MYLFGVLFNSIVIGFEFFLASSLAARSFAASSLAASSFSARSFATRSFAFLQIVPLTESLPSSSETQSWNSIGIEKWVEVIVQAKNLCGMLSFDVIVDKYTNEVYGLDCRPFLHSSIMKFNHKSEVCRLWQNV